MCVATSVSIHVASATFPSVGCNLRRSTVSSSLLDRVLEIYELKCFFFFFFFERDETLPVEQSTSYEGCSFFST